MAELIVSAVLPVLFEKLTSRELLNFATREGVRSKLKKWENTLKMIEALLIDAEEKQLTNIAVEMWLDDLQDLAYDAEDILDQYATEALRRKLKIEEHQASTSRARKLIPACCIGSTPSDSWSDSSMLSKIDGVTSRLEELCRLRTDLGLVEIAGGRSNVSQHRLPPTTCLPTETFVYGREADKANILEKVLRHEPGGANFGVILIVGMGGIGKTKLAQQVYNDKEVEDFNPKAWVCVSDDFDVLNITKAILKLTTWSSCDNKEFSVVQNLLKDALNGKKYLIVLDDVWCMSHESWESLQAPFMAGAPGSKIIVTSRSTEVALTMRPREIYELKLLSDEDCWSIVVKYALNNRGTSANWNLDMIREKVVRKCRGLPLVAKTLGGLLYYKESEDEWMDILDRKIWDMESNILPVLRLSYYRLPSHLKRCFAYCAILPKDFEFEEKELVFLWMAEGLIQQSSGNKQLEDLGGEYFHDLLSRSFFQTSKGNTSKFIMHDFVNDLALMVSGKLSFRLEDELEFNNRSTIFEKTRYASCHQYHPESKFDVFNDAKHLRTFLEMSNYGDATSCISHTVIPDFLLRCKWLRVLSLQNYYIVELPDSIGGLRLLRYLNLSGCKIKSLPESVDSLCNLQTLILRNCHELLKWPCSMGNLINLRNFDIFGASSIKEMPEGIRKWEYLQTLSKFIVSKDFKFSLKILKHLKFIWRELHISGLENVIDLGLENVIDLEDKILRDKKGLKVLLLEWGSRFDESRDEEVDKKVLDMLQPHQNLENLTINSYGGTNFPSWVGDGLYSKMTILELVDCKKCTSLPSVGLLGSLKSLTIKGIRGVKLIGSEFYGEGWSKPFLSLETLYFENLEEWECWHPVKGNDSFPKLQELYIVNCPKLAESLPKNLSLLKKFVISDCSELLVSLSTFSRDQLSATLTSLHISHCSKLASLMSRGQLPTTIKDLKIHKCSNLEDILLPEMLETLDIADCPKLKSIVASFHSNMSLRNIYIQDCPNLVSFQKRLLSLVVRIDGDQNLKAQAQAQASQMLLSSLKELTISNCPKLTSHPISPSSTFKPDISNCPLLK